MMRSHLPPSRFLSHQGRGKGGMMRPHLPPSRFLSHQGRGKGGGERRCGGSVPASVNDTASTTQITPLPQRGRGAGGEGGPHLPPGPLPLPRCGRGRGRVPPHQSPASPQLTPLPHCGSERGEYQLLIWNIAYSPTLLLQCRGLSVLFGAGQDDAEIISSLCHSCCQY